MKKLLISFGLSSFLFFSQFVITPSFLASNSQDNTKGQSVKLVTPDGQKTILYSGSYALLIGVKNYRNNWATLSEVPEDLEAVKKVLEESHGFKVETLLDPTKEDFVKKLDDFILKYGSGKNNENRLLIYYSGHGYTTEVNGAKEGYLVLVDTPRPRSDEDENNISLLQRRSISTKSILSYAQEIQSKHVLFVFDSCFSGTIFLNKGNPIPEPIQKNTSKPTREFITAGDENQEVPARSIFRRLFVRALEGEADIYPKEGDSYITGKELGIFLETEVPKYQSGQTPQFGKINNPDLNLGDLVFFTNNLSRNNSPITEPTLTRKSYSGATVNRIIPVGTLVITLMDPGIEIIVDGKSYGEAKVSGEKIRLDGYEVKTVQLIARAFGRKDKIKEVKLKPNDEVNIKFKLSELATLTPLEGRTQELEETVRRNTEDITALDERLSKEIAGVDAKAVRAQEIADAAKNAADQAENRAEEVNQNVETLRSNLDKYTLLTTVSVKFKSSSGILTEEAKAELDRIAVEAKNHQGYTLEIQGFTYSHGSTTLNDHLSYERAESVKRYLAKQHEIPTFKIAIVGLGKLIEEIRSKDKRAENQRVDVRLFINNAVN